MAGTVNPSDSRVNALLRLVGIVFLGLGIVMTIETYIEASAASLVPELVPTLYLCSTMLMVTGLVAVVSRYRESVPPKS